MLLTPAFWPAGPGDTLRGLRERPGPAREAGAGRLTPERASDTRTARRARPKGGAPPAPRWADRGWWLAIEYGVLARDRFLKRLPQLRGLGQFKELLEPGGQILYRNLFRDHQLQQAWDLFTALRPWQERLVCYVKGDVVEAKAAQDALWCAAFLQRERPCRGGASTKGRPAGCEGARVLLVEGQWEERGDQTRHALTFAHVDPQGWLRFDREALAAWARAGRERALCPRTPFVDPDAFASAFEDVAVRSLGWPLVAELGKDLERRLGAKALEAEHGFVLRKGEPPLDAHAQVELRWHAGRVVVRRPGEPGRASIAAELRLSPAVTKVLEQGVLLRGVRLGEGFMRLEGGHYEVEQRFVLSTRIHLGSVDRPEEFTGYALRTHPRQTPEWTAWADRVSGAMP